MKIGNTITIRFDGGCSPNPGRKYGSWDVELNGVVVVRRERILFGHGTNNEAEFDACRAAVWDALWHLAGQSRTTHAFIVSDSKIVLNRLTKRNVVYKKAAWKESSERMFKYANNCLDLLRLFGSFTAQWQPREHNVMRFGH